MPTRRSSWSAAWRGRRVLPFTAALVIGGIVAAKAAAHDFWIIPDPFHVPEGGTLEALGQTSTRFPSSVAAVAVERVADARIVGVAGSSRVTELSRRGTSLVLRHRPGAPGQYVVAVALVPGSVRSTAAAFRRWLGLEGAPGEAARLEREGAFRGLDSLTRRMLKYAKAIAQVGDGGPRAFSLPTGHALEFVADIDPAAARVGDTLAIRLVFNGRAVVGAEAHAGAAEWPLADGAQASEPRDMHLRADEHGVLRLPITRGGAWNVRGMHVTSAAGGAPGEWDVHWATMVFLVDAARPAPAAGQDAPGA